MLAALRRVIPIVLMLALVVAGVLLAAPQFGKLADIRLEETRTELPGARTVQLDARKYVVWIETRGGDLTDFNGSSADVPAEIRPAGDGVPLPLSDYGGSFTTESGGREGAALATVTPPEAGRYVIAGPSTRMVPNPSVVLGVPTRGAVLRIVLGIVLVVIGLIGAIVAIILAIVLPRKDKDDAAPQSPVVGGDPFNAG
jgi:hypothetical protein